MKAFIHKWLGLLLVLPMLLFTGCGLFGGGDGKLHAGYYSEVIMQPDGEFVGRGAMSEKEIPKAEIVYKVEMDEKDKDKVTSIRAMQAGKAVNASWYDTLQSGFGGYFSEIAITYDENGKKYEWLNAQGKPTYGFYMSYSLRFKADEKGKTTTAFIYDSQGKLGIGKGLAAAQISYERDDAGRLTKVSFANESGAPAFFSSGDGSEVYLTYDEKAKDKISSIFWYNDKGEYAKGPMGCEKLYTYDDQKRLIKVEHKDAKGDPQNGRYLDWIRKNQISAGALPDNVNGGACRWEGYPVNIARLEELRLARAEPGCETEYVYEGKSEYPSEIRFDLNGGSNGDGIRGYRMKYSKDGKITELTAIDEAGNTVPIAERDIDAMKFSYDANGGISEIAFSINGNPVAFSKNGDGFAHVAKIAYTYDENGAVSSEAYYDITGEPAELHIYGMPYAKLGFTYDESGERQCAFFGKNGEELTVDPLAQFYGTYEYSQPDGRVWRFNITKEAVTYSFRGGSLSFDKPASYQAVSLDGINAIWGDGNVELNCAMAEGGTYSLSLNFVIDPPAYRYEFSWPDSHYSFITFRKI